MSIDRFGLVSRHNPVFTKANTESPLSIGNGEFAFTADITGLQSFPDAYEDKIPLTTQSQWGWHTIPAPPDMDTKSLRMEMFDTYGSEVGYPTSSEGQSELYGWLRENPHRLHLGRIGLRIMLSNGKKAGIDDIKGIHQKLDLWRGLLISHFTVEGIPVMVKTCCHPVYDILAIFIESQLIAQKRLVIDFAFPYGSPDKTGADWTKSERHETEIAGVDKNRIDLLRKLDEEHYFIRTEFSDGAQLSREDRHRFVLTPAAQSSNLELVCCFTPEVPRKWLPSFGIVSEASMKHWENFWNQGGAVEFAGSGDTRANELERRVVLSQYLTAIQCAGTLPPQETGLTFNSWGGKFHLEMHWWHAAHFPLWGRTHLLEKSLWWYQSILGRAREWAKYQGYEGARWPKMVGPRGIDSPSSIGPLLIWQQPHPIVYAELCYRAHPDHETLERYRDIVFNTADFMASYAVYDQETERYVLGPPLIPAQENHRPPEAFNPTFELIYWAYGLKLAQQWRNRLGMPKEPNWERVIAKLSQPTAKDGIYLAHENCPDTFSRFNTDHPSMLGVLGILPGEGIDRKIMLNTLHTVLSEWQFETSWGWDFPLTAMTAARLGEQKSAVNVLLMDAIKNTYLPNGHNYQTDGLSIYLPGNGGLLTAVAMMAAGWDNCPSIQAPGFPQDGSWTVKWEGLSPMP